MIKKLSWAAFALSGIVALGGCNLFERTATTEPPPKKPPAADYQAAVSATPPAGNIRGICYNAADLSVYRVRMTQMELTVLTLQCQTASGARAYESDYASFLNKFKGDLAANSRSLQQMAGRKRFNVDVVVTEFSNRTGQRAQVDKEFCARGRRALDWALSAQVTTLEQVPPPYDLGPEMNVFPCPTP